MEIIAKTETIDERIFYIHECATRAYAMRHDYDCYQTDDGLTKIETKFEQDTVWLSLDQMAELFQSYFVK